ncbi:unnamed protein product [Cyclocybe aegerita]|uniref:Kinesin motor domain-containing protein n=1 Tax=Cyclocybe aegerita TaxID=1973307 RepID=A0A8S0Y141_CYCAE|nr:unnamed protein product [Cyclocybe aegerita]
MATRRPASSRARLNTATNPMPPPQQQRPRSVLARPASRIGEDSLQSSSGSSSSQQPHKSQQEGDTHIQVILRCRGRSEREIQENSPGIVQIEGAKAKDLTIETTAPVSSLGTVTLAPTRTYPFDLVFGPEATQSMIYHDVVGPMLNEVLLGYNCTLFAYGQTGTGKTYTMQGDLAPTPMGNPSSHAGIIPRVLFRLFHELEKSSTDFMVKVSYIELYNEELRDLLANDAAANNGAKDKGPDGGLKIFDDANKRGVFIQGVEEIAVKDSKDALALLTKGSERRQIAATKFNDHSSRSHSVLSLTVHLKEKTTMGDDLLKVGKLNLVDLAGSENIGRSGAENKRAREAGMINQSLLTLGRVINALVDKAQHVPYRESKLTRILQDSLGGRTKTCIIATISPARSNLEETLSTLDYALRAKSIRNKPELNQRMTRNSLLKEYVAEIERLKADVLAAREKNGIYFAEETWMQLEAERELRETELSEAKKQVQIIENQMRAVRDEFDQSIAVLKRREEELKHTRGQLAHTENTLRQREQELQQMATAYEEEVIVRRAYENTEAQLNVVASDLRDVAAQSVQDLGGVFEKLDRKNKVHLSNKRVVSENERLISAVTESLMKQLSELSQLLHATRSNMESETEQFRSSQQTALSNHIREIDDHFEKAHELFQQIDTECKAEDKALDIIKREVQSAGAAFRSEVSSWGEKLKSTSTRMCEETLKVTIEQVALLEQSLSTLHSLGSNLSRDVRSYLADERKTFAEMQALAKELAAKETSRLKQQNELLARMLVEQRQEAEKAKDEMLQRVSGLLGDFMQKRDESLRASIDNLQCSNKEVEDLLNSTYRRQTEAHDGMAEKNSNMDRRVQKLSAEGNDAKTSSLKVVGKTKDVIKTSMNGIQSTVSSSIATYSTWVHKKTQGIEESSDNAFEEHSRAKRARIEATNGVYATLEELHSKEQELLTASSKGVEAHSKQSLSWIGKQVKGAKEYEVAATKNLESIEHAASNLASKGIKDDTPTGATPRKRKWQYTHEWSLTRSREELLGALRQQQVSDQDEEMREESQDREVENDAPAQEMLESSKASTPTLEVPPAAPLVESRRRNHVSTIPSRSSRRAR